MHGWPSVDRAGELVVDPIEDPDAVDRRREALGLPPLAAHIARVKKAYGLAN